MKNVNIYAFADEACPMIDGQIKAMHRNGLQGLEVRNADNENVSDISASKAGEIRKKLDEANLKTWSIGSPIGKISIVDDSFEEHIEKFKRTLETAKILNAANIRIFSFYIPKEKRPEDYKNKVIENLSTLSEIAKPYSVTLCHENEKGIYGDNAERCLEILKAVPEIKAVFDPANFVQCGQDTLNAWSTLKQYVCYLHIKDSIADGTVVPAGKGKGNVKKIVDDYLSTGKTAVTIEPHLRIFDGFSALERKDDNISIDENNIFKTSDDAFDFACKAFRSLL